MYLIYSIAKNTFIEAIRDRVLYILIFFAVLMILSSIVFSGISAEQYNKIVIDLGLTAISIFGILISIFLGMGLVYKELEKKTVYNIFSKPVDRYQFIIGKYFGLAFTLLVITVSMSLILFILVLFTEYTHGGLIKFYYGGPFHLEFFISIYFEYLECLIIIGIALLFSSFTTPILAAFMSFMFFVAGRFSSDIRLLAEEIEHPLTKVFSELIYKVIPNLEKFDFRSEAVYGGIVSFELLSLTTVYACIYVVILLILSIIIFQKKEFN